MALCLKKQKAKNKITEALMAKGRQNADITDPIYSVLPPYTAGTNGNSILIDKNVPAERVKIIRTASENGGTDRQKTGQIGSR